MKKISTSIDAIYGIGTRQIRIFGTLYNYIKPVGEGPTEADNLLCLNYWLSDPFSLPHVGDNYCQYAKIVNDQITIGEIRNQIFQPVYTDFTAWLSEEVKKAYDLESEDHKNNSPKL